jgi:hypothetical protein
LFDISIYSKLVAILSSYWHGDFFRGEIPFFSEKCFKKEYSVTNSLFSEKQFARKWGEKSKKWIPATGKVAEDFSTSYFECCQICLNILMGDHHLSNITKLKKKPLYWQPFFWFGIPHCFKILSSVAISMIFWEKSYENSGKEF